jgi:hypothetical protein
LRHTWRCNVTETGCYALHVDAGSSIQRPFTLLLFHLKVCAETDGRVADTFHVPVFAFERLDDILEVGFPYCEEFT